MCMGDHIGRFGVVGKSAVGFCVEGAGRGR